MSNRPKMLSRELTGGFTAIVMVSSVIWIASPHPSTAAHIAD